MEKTLFEQSQELAAETTYRQLYLDLEYKYAELEEKLYENEKMWQRAAEEMNKERIAELNNHIADLRATLQYFTVISEVDNCEYRPARYCGCSDCHDEEDRGRV